MRSNGPYWWRRLRAPRGVKLTRDGREIVSSRIVARMLGVSYPSLHRWKSAGFGPKPSPSEGSTLYYDREEVIRWLQQHVYDPDFRASAGRWYHIQEVVSEP